MTTLTVTKAKNEKEKMMGLIGKDKPYPFLLKTRFGIHTFGVNFPIDILVLNNSHHVVQFFEKLQPNRVYFWNPKYNFVLELPEQTIADKKIKIGEKIKLVIK